MTRRMIYGPIDQERWRQSEKWSGDHGHGAGDCSSPSVPVMVKVAVLVEEVGEVARAALEFDPTAMRAELIQVAAVAVAIIEGIDASALDSTTGMPIRSTT